MILLYILGAFVGIIIIYLSIVLFWPGIQVLKQFLPGVKSGVSEKRDNPVTSAKDVQCPVLIQVCEKDNLVSPKSVNKIASILGDRAKVIRYPIGHFDIYTGDHFERAVSDQIDFFKKHLK